MDFHSHFSYDSAHNAATTFEHMVKFIQWMYEDNFFINDGIIYDTTDGCSKQYICKIQCGYYLSWNLRTE